MLNVLLKDVMTQGYLYVEEHQSTGKALGVMRDMNISCLFVLKNGIPTGIVTERRILLKALAGVNIYTSPVTDVMSTPLLSLTPEHTIAEACDYMLENQIRHLGIIDSFGALRGTVTAGNIVNMMGSESFSSTALAKDVMTADVAMLEVDSTLRQAAAAIIEKRTCCAIVLEDKYPAGVVSEKDITRCLGYGQDIEKLSIRKIISRPVLGIEETDTVAHAILMLRKHHVHRVIVFDSTGKVSGLLAHGSLTGNIRRIIN